MVMAGGEVGEIVQLDPSGFADALPGLARLLHACVEGGASVNFVLPFTVGQAEDWWRAKLAAGVADGTRRLLVAREGGTILGTVNLDLAMPPNQAHRAEVSKLLVLPGARGRGIARALMRRIEEVARQAGRTLLVLDTVTGSAADHLYRSLGWIEAGHIPGFALSVDGTRVDSTTIFYKHLPQA